MNQAFHGEVTHTSARRQSLRNRPSPQIDKRFFKKVYKPKQAVATKNEALNKEEEQLHNKYFMLKKAAATLFTPVHPAAKQAKAIANYRLKKLKKMLASQAQLVRAIKEGNLLPVSPRMRGQDPSKTSGRSTHARSRVRESNGKFANLDKCNSFSQTTTTADFFERNLNTPVRNNFGGHLDEPCVIESLFKGSEYTPGSTKMSTVDMICEDVSSLNLLLAKPLDQDAEFQKIPPAKALREATQLPGLSEEDENRGWDIMFPENFLSEDMVETPWSSDASASGWQELQEYLSEMEPADIFSLFSEV